MSRRDEWKEREERDWQEREEREKERKKKEEEERKAWKEAEKKDRERQDQEARRVELEHDLKRQEEQQKRIRQEKTRDVDEKLKLSWDERMFRQSKRDDKLAGKPNSLIFLLLRFCFAFLHNLCFQTSF